MSLFAYFGQCADLDEARKLFRELAHKFHPDHGGDAEQFKAMVEEFQHFQHFTWNNAGKAKWGADYESKRDFTLSPETMERLRAVLRFHDVETEIIGTWLWVSGNTRAYKEQLKELGFRFCGKKKSWTYHSEPWKKRNGRVYSMDDIRSMHGTQRVDQEPDEQVA